MNKFKNPNRIEGGRKSGEITRLFWKQKENEYLLTPNKCSECEVDLDWKHRNNKFCSSSCSAKWTNRNRVDKCPNKNGTKICKCSCGEQIEINVRSRITRCEFCKKIDVKKKHLCSICGEIDCSRQGICSLPNKIFKGDFHEYFGFDVNLLGSNSVFKEFERVKTIVLNLYAKYSIPEICEIIDYKKNVTTLYSTLIRLGFRFRSHSDSMKKSYMDGKIKIKLVYPKCKTGWHETWEGNQIFYRSSYELEYAQQLDEKKIKYEVEQLRIEYWDTQELKYRVAIPDFYLPETNEIVEIKSDWTYNEQNMRDKVQKFKELGYNFKLILEKVEYPNSI